MHDMASGGRDGTRENSKPVMRAGKLGQRCVGTGFPEALDIAAARPDRHIVVGDAVKQPDRLAGRARVVAQPPRRGQHVVQRGSRQRHALPLAVDEQAVEFQQR